MKWSASFKAPRGLQAFPLLGFLSLGCSGPVQGGSTWDGSGPETGGKTPETVEEKQNSSVLCAATESLDGPAIFQLRPMNLKLRHYPELAAEIGMSEVVGCEGALTFIERLAEFRRNHPDFDDDEPLDWNERALPAKPDDSAGNLEFPKIQNGPAATNLPVVKLTFKTHTSSDPDYADFSNKTINCSGTFIAKNFILTAAHCIAKSAVDWCITNEMPLQNCRPEWFKYGRWSIQFTTFQLTDVWAVSEVHPAWMGQQIDTNRPVPASNTPKFPSMGLSTYIFAEGARHDIALLYIDDDTRLPFNVELDGAQRISIIEPPTNLGDPEITWPMTFYGWGSPSSTPVLRMGDPVPHFSLPIVNNDTVIATNFTSTTSQPCEGDSGGPLVRTLRVQTNDGGAQFKQAMVGVLSGGSHGECTMPPNTLDTNTWTRVDRSVDFIESVMKRWYGPYFECNQKPDADGDITEMEVAECWGWPCRAPADCGTPELGMFCRNPGSDLNMSKGVCETCKNQGGGCGCIVGQCLWGPESKPPRPPGKPPP